MHPDLFPDGVDVAFRLGSHIGFSHRSEGGWVGDDDRILLPSEWHIDEAHALNAAKALLARYPPQSFDESWPIGTVHESVCVYLTPCKRVGDDPREWDELDDLFCEYADNLGWRAPASHDAP